MAEQSLTVIPDVSSSQNPKTLSFPQADFSVAMRVDGRVRDSALVDFSLALLKWSLIRDPFCDPLALLTTVFHRFCCACRVLYVIETAL
jgi:hypothetical protein